MTETDGVMNVALRMARSGEREEALRLFAQVVAQQPDEAEAWLWISELSTTLDEQVAALDRAVACIDASSETSRTLQERLNAIRGAEALPSPFTRQEPLSASIPEDSNVRESCSEAIFQWAERLVVLGEEREAKRQLEALLEENPRHERSLLLLSELVSTREEKQRLLERVIEINPASAEAAQRLGTHHKEGQRSLHASAQPHSQRPSLLRRAMSIFSR